jgi:hypothetical protein
MHITRSLPALWLFHGVKVVSQLANCLSLSLSRSVSVLFFLFRKLVFLTEQAAAFVKKKKKKNTEGSIMYNKQFYSTNQKSLITPVGNYASLVIFKSPSCFSCPPFWVCVRECMRACVHILCVCMCVFSKGEGGSGWRECRTLAWLSS